MSASGRLRTERAITSTLASVSPEVGASWQSSARMLLAARPRVEGHRLEGNTTRDQRGAWTGVEARRGLDYIDPEQAARRDAAHELDHLARREPAGRRAAGAGRVRSIERVD